MWDESWEESWEEAEGRRHPQWLEERKRKREQQLEEEEVPVPVPPLPLKLMARAASPTETDATRRISHRDSMAHATLPPHVIIPCQTVRPLHCRAGLAHLAVECGVGAVVSAV